jgi:23S rRNA (guanosine2251-2'-O)-methyltransferase
VAAERIVAGPRAVTEAVRVRPRDIAVVYVSPRERKALRELVALASSRGVRVETKNDGELDGLAGELRHQGVLAVTGEFRYLELEALLDPAPRLLVALDEVSDPHNFGAILRSAVALGADGVIVPRHRNAPVTSAVVRVSAGATEHARVARVTNLARALGELGERGLSTVGLDAAGTVSITALPPAPGGRVLVIGSEGYGLRRLVRERCALLARIELRGPIESLNAAVAAGIAIHEATRVDMRRAEAGEGQG